MGRVFGVRGSTLSPCGRGSRRSTRGEGSRPLYAFGFAHPATGRNRAPILPTANTGTMGQAVADVARWADPAGAKVLVLVDSAGWHVAGKRAVPPDVALHHLPSCAPGLQPAEPLRPLVREGRANKTFPTLAALQEPLARRCGWLADPLAVVKGAVGFHWAVRLG